MKLHEAIEKLLKQIGRPMTANEIANELNKNKWYQKKDCSNIAPSQVHARTKSKSYSNIFENNGSAISLIGQPKTNATTPKNTQQHIQRHTTRAINVTPLEKHLMDKNNFKKAAFIDSLVPNDPGLYCIQISNISKLPAPFDEHLKTRNHNIIYIGIASQSLQKRFLNQELRASGHGTFFRSIGAVLGFRPEKGSLIAKTNKRNYKFRSDDEKQIINWINNNLIVNWTVFNGDFEKVETELIQKYCPLLNIAKNPRALRDLLKLRAECVKIANS